jgi:hypothetical protein
VSLYNLGRSRHLTLTLLNLAATPKFRQKWDVTERSKLSLFQVRSAFLEFIHMATHFSPTAHQIIHCCKLLCVHLLGFTNLVAKSERNYILAIRRWNYPCNTPWRLIELWDVEAPILSRQSAHRWRWRQPYAPAACPLPPERFVVLTSVRGWVNPRATMQLKRLGKFKISDDLIGNRNCDLPACSHCILVQKPFPGHNMK